jgi:hypothetical protein
MPAGVTRKRDVAFVDRNRDEPALPTTSRPGLFVARRTEDDAQQQDQDG